MKQMKLQQWLWWSHLTRDVWSLLFPSLSSKRKIIILCLIECADTFFPSVITYIHSPGSLKEFWKVISSNYCYKQKKALHSIIILIFQKDIRHKFVHNDRLHSRSVQKLKLYTKQEKSNQACFSHVRLAWHSS